MNYIKKHKLASFVILVYIIVVGFAYFLYKLFIGSSGLPVYGDRLDDIANVPITEEQLNKIEESILKDEQVLKVTKPYLNGKILKVVVTVAHNTEVAPTKEYANKIMAELTDEQKKLYDVELYISKFYDCTLEATGKMDEEGNFTENVTVKFSKDLSKNEYTLDYGMTNVEGVNYNKEQQFEITEDGEYVIYGYTKDKKSEAVCSIKITKKASDDQTREETVNTIAARSFPFIGYSKAGKDTFVWTKDR